MEPFINRLFREGTRRGLGGSPRWATVAMVTGGIRVFRRFTNPPPEVMWRQAMQPGDRFEVTVKEPPPTRRMRRKAQKLAQKQDRRTARRAERVDRRGARRKASAS